MTKPPRTLDDDAYNQAHSAFRAACDQQALMLQWLRERLQRWTPPREPIHALSVGCGNGALDSHIARALLERVDALDYHGVEPNRAACDAFERRLERLSPARLQARTSALDFARFETESRFEAIFISHSLYYLSDPRAAIDRALAMLADDGVAVIFHGTPRGLKEISARFKEELGLANKKAFFAAQDVEAHLRDRGVRFEREILPATIDVTPCLQLNSDDDAGVHLLNFLIQAQSRELPETTLARIVAHVKDVSVLSGPRWLCHHPTWAFWISGLARTTASRLKQEASS